MRDRRRGVRERQRRKLVAGERVECRQVGGGDQGREGDRPRLDERCEGDDQLLPGQGHVGQRGRGGEEVQRDEHGRDGQADRVLDVGGRAASAVRAAPGGQVGRVRRVRRGRDLDGGVRVAEVDL